MARSTHDPLPGAPEPWAPSVMPAFRSRPPYLMTEMIAAEPALVERLVHRLVADPAIGRLADALEVAVAEHLPIITTGCGTSEHAAMGVAEMLNEALDLPGGREVQPVQALEYLRRPLRQGVVIGVSHEGGTTATNEALRATRESGATTALMTVGGSSPGAELADIVVQTGEQDRSWCHTVGYLSPLVAGTVLAARLGQAKTDARVLRALLDVSDDHRATSNVAAGLTGIDRLFVAGSGVDLVSARELAIKVTEGARLPAHAHDVETLLHGHLAAATRWTGLVLILTEAERRPPIVIDRARRLLEAASSLGVPAAGILSERLVTTLEPELMPAGRLVIPRVPRLRGVTASLFGAAIPLQLLAERLARARGVNPDTLGREDPAQAAAHA
jgi:glucosamine 6-phosphate synthetase-like amidotransferase/phosphosugar isomerase protein